MAWNGQWSYGNWTERDRTNLHRFFSPIYKWATKFMAFSWVSFQGKFSSRAWVMRQSLCHKPSPSCWKWVVQTLHSLRLILGTWINIFTTDSNVPSPTRLSQRLFGLVKSRSKCTSWCHHPTGKYSHIYIYNYICVINDSIYIYTHRTHGAGIYANMTGVYWWDPCYHIYSIHGSYGIYIYIFFFSPRKFPIFTCFHPYIPTPRSPDLPPSFQLSGPPSRPTCEALEQRILVPRHVSPGFFWRWVVC